MGPLTNLPALPCLACQDTTTRWTFWQSRCPDIDNDVKGPPDPVKNAGGAKSCVTDMKSSLASASTFDSIFIGTNTLSAEPASIISTTDLASPMSSPSTSPSSSLCSSLSSFSSASSSSVDKISSPYKNNTSGKSSFAAPLLSPASSTDSLGDFFSSTTFLGRVFPNSNIDRLAVPVNSHIAGWKLAVLDDVETDSRTLYAQAACGSDQVCSREGVIALLDYGDEDLECDQVVVVLEKKDADLAQQLHSLLFIGGNLLPATASSHCEDYVLVGLEL